MSAKLVDLVIVDGEYPKWDEIWSKTKPESCVVVVSKQPHTTSIIKEQIEHFRYQWYWIVDEQVTDVLVFYKNLPTYNPQGIVYDPKTVVNGKGAGGSGVQGSEIGSGKGKLRTAGTVYIQEYTNYPDHVLRLDNHIKLYDYLIKTYSNEGETVFSFDNPDVVRSCMRINRIGISTNPVEKEEIETVDLFVFE